MLAEKIFAIAPIADQSILWLLVGLSVLSISLITERYFSLGKIASQSSKIREQLKMALASQNSQGLRALANDTSSLEGRALNYGINHIKSNGVEGLEEAFNSMALLEKPDLEKHLSFMATLGSNAPYIGLLGTVLGIMKAFNDLAQNAEAGQQTVMAGISMALVATAAGLFVAIPAVLAYNYYQRQVKSILQSLETVKEVCLSQAKRKDF